MKLLKKYKAFTYACASYHSGQFCLILSKKCQAFVPSNGRDIWLHLAWSRGSVNILIVQLAATQNVT